MLSFLLANALLWCIFSAYFDPLNAAVLAPVVYFVGPTLIREVAYNSVKIWASFRTPLPPRAVLPLPENVIAIAFPGLGADTRQTLIPRGFFPNAARLLPCNVSPCESPENQHLWEGGWRVYLPFRNNIAQHDDVMHALNHVRKEMARNPNSRFIFFGSSRGAAVALQVAELLTSTEVARVPLVICEGAFTTVEDVIDTRFPLPVRVLVRAILALFTRYKPSANAAWSPLQAATHFIHKKLPIVLVTSQADTVVVPVLTKRLAVALRNSGLEHVYEIELADSPHSGYAWFNDDDRALYVTELDKIYKKHV